MIFKIAFKNLFENKTKTFIILSLIGLGTFLVILGLGIWNHSIRQTEGVCISDFSGDLLIVGKAEKEGQIVELLGTGTVGVNLGNMKMPYVTEFEKLTAKLNSMENVLAFTPSVVSSFNIIAPPETNVDELDEDRNENSENRQYFPMTNILGIQPETYTKVFDTIKVYEGTFPTSNDESFFLLPKELKEKFEKYYEKKLNVGDEISINSFASGKNKMIKTTISGFFEYAHSETAIGGISYCDLSSCRQLAGITLGAKTAAQIPDSVDLSLADLSEDELFGFDDFMEKDVEVQTSSMNLEEVENILGDTELRDQLNLSDSTGWNHIAIRLKNPVKTEEVQKELNEWFEAENIAVEALTWQNAMMSFYGIISSVRVILMVVLCLLAIVVLIVIMNTLVVAVMERTGEIGTMRAIGAQKGFVKKIFYTETFIMSFLGVLIGTILAFIVAAIFNSFDIRLNEIAAALFGVYYIKVSISVMAIVSTALAMFIAGFLANIYPVGLALKISPLEAINK